MTTEHSYGFVVVYRGTESDRFLLVNQVSHWSFPKGHIEEGETPLIAATRELEEETGITDVTIVPGIEFKEEYVFDREGIPTHKVNVFYLATVTRTEGLTAQEGEVAECVFVPEAEALALLSFPESQNILRAAVSALESIPPMRL